MEIALGVAGLLCLYIATKLKDEQRNLFIGLAIVGVALVFVAGAIATKELKDDGIVCTPVGAPPIQQCQHVPTP
jgi:hypothetical protein